MSFNQTENKERQGAISLGIPRKLEVSIVGKKNIGWPRHLTGRIIEHVICMSLANMLSTRRLYDHDHERRDKAAAYPCSFSQSDLLQQEVLQLLNNIGINIDETLNCLLTRHCQD